MLDPVIMLKTASAGVGPASLQNINFVVNALQIMKERNHSTKRDEDSPRKNLPHLGKWMVPIALYKFLAAMPFASLSCL